MPLSNIPVATIDPVFKSQLDQLKETGRRIYASTLLGHQSISDESCDVSASKQRKWQMPSKWTWDLNLFHISGQKSIKEAFDRTRLNNLYVRALLKGAPIDDKDKAAAGEGRVSDCQAIKIQVDHLAIQERAFRLRHASSVRCAMHAAVRRRGHSPWNDSPAGVPLIDLGGGIVPPDSVVGPVGGIFTTLLRYLYIVINSGYNEGPVDV